MDYRKIYQESLDHSDDGYVLKSNIELHKIIENFGCGETDFHTADIERLLKEHKKLYELVGLLTIELGKTNWKEDATIGLIQEAANALKWYDFTK